MIEETWQVLQESLRRRSADTTPPWKPFLLVDECLNDPRIWAAVRRLQREGAIGGAQGAWIQNRIGAAGELVRVSGQMPPPELRAFDYGKPVVGYSFSDRKVAILTARFLGAAGRVVILTANWRRRDRDGLRQILEDEFASILGDQFVKTCGLLVIAKRGKADLDMFIDAFCSCIRAHSWAAGYETALLP